MGMVSFKLRHTRGDEYTRVARPLWAKLFFGNRRLFKSLLTGALILVPSLEIEQAEANDRQARASQFEIKERS